uniref:Uncharacterized protein n=1 Tax=Arundo donax TaxID=35708 RepID=A0A0A8YXB0_ARUDO
MPNNTYTSNFTDHMHACKKMQDDRMSQYIMEGPLGSYTKLLTAPDIVEVHI